jgi:hypothetical protein
MATTGQLQALLRPHVRRQTVNTPPNELRRQSLAGCTALPRSRGMRAWYLTGDGVRMVKDFPALRDRTYPVTSATAASLKTPHTLTVLRTYLAFVADARERGDEHGFLDWTPEVSHSLGDGEKVIADALLHYTLTGPGQRTKLRALAEIDRTTISSERLASKLIDYARLWSYEPQPAGRNRSRQPALPEPAWLRWCPVFPRILFVLTGGSRQVLDNRISDLQAMTAQHPLVATMARTVPLGAAVLDDIKAQRPTGEVWTPLNGGQPRSWTEL